MAKIISLLLLAFAVSLDSFNVGLTYGLRKIKIPFISIAVIACCSAISLYLAMFVGHLFGKFISAGFAEKLGGFILIALGIWVFLQIFKKDQVDGESEEEKTIFNFEIKSFGLVINILRKPSSADFDRSGTITGVEAVILGFALSLDAFGAGIGASILGFSTHFLALAIVIMSATFIWSGTIFGSIFSSKKWIQNLTFLPGVILMLIGIWKL